MYNLSIENAENNQINEFIPSGKLITHVSSYSNKNILVLNKIDSTKNWTFEPTEESPEAQLKYEFKVEFLEYKPMQMYSNNMYSASMNNHGPAIRPGLQGRYGSVSNTNFSKF